MNLVEINNEAAEYKSLGFDNPQLCAVAARLFGAGVVRYARGVPAYALEAATAKLAALTSKRKTKIKSETPKGAKK